MTKPHTLVLGIGNALLRDDGAGVHAVRYLQAHYGDEPHTEFLDAGTLSFTLLGSVQDADHLIIIDAAELQAAPGAVRVFEGEDMDRFLGGRRKLSVHEVSVIDLLAMARLMDRLPVRRAIIGIQAADMDWGDTPTPDVADAVVAAGEQAIGLLRHWREA